MLNQELEEGSFCPRRQKGFKETINNIKLYNPIDFLRKEMDIKE